MNNKYWIILAISLTAVFVTVYSANKTAATFRGSSNELLLRKIGHELLLSAGDDTSRVMPVKELGNNQYRIIFENKLSLEPDSVISITNRILSQSSFPGNYAVNVIDCQSTENVYGFKMTASAKDNIIPCRGRTLPAGCYFVDLVFTPAAESAPQPAYLVSGCALAALLLAGILYYRKRKTTPAPIAVPMEREIKGIRLGNYIFDADQNLLELGDEKTLLTNKESKLLCLFAAAVNKVIDRNTLQKEVWENEGVIVTRSLDMFVSKLRKKLQQDPAIKIVNIPGKGYKLEVPA